jgi:hypothetical protein
MNMTEAEQRQSYAAVHARLMGRPVRKIKAPVLQIETGRKPVDASYHVTLYRAYQAQFQASFSMGGSFTINPTEAYCPYRSEIVFHPEPVFPKTMKQIAMEVLACFPGVTLEEIKGKHRARLLAVPRQLVMYEIARQLPSKSYPEIGRFLGGRDHTTILHAVHKMKALHENDADSEAWMIRKSRKGEVRAALSEGREGEKG